MRYWSMLVAAVLVGALGVGAPSTASAATPGVDAPVERFGPWDADIIFPDDQQVVGKVHLDLRRDGSYDFSGSFHATGGPSYDVDLTWLLLSMDNIAYTFTTKGHVSGSTEGGADHTWANHGTSADLAAGWGAFERQIRFNRWRATVNWTDVTALDILKEAARATGPVITVVAPA